jgi:lysozyme family protein
LFSVVFKNLNNLMAEFKLFEPILLSNEGFYSFVPGDSGGETWEGISRNNYPKWPGWAIIDSYKTNGVFASRQAANALLKPVSALQTLVDTFYKCSEWDTMNADEINNQSIANFLVDWEVNSGEGAPIKHTQIILGIIPQVVNMGPKTLAGINANSTQEFFNQLQAARHQFYLDVVAAHPSDQQFLSNWLSRTSSFKFLA